MKQDKHDQISTDPLKVDALQQTADAPALQQYFSALALSELGLDELDFDAVLAAKAELTEIDQHRVAEYGKQIANDTANYTDELLNLVQAKDLDETGKKLNEVVSVAQQLNKDHLLNQQAEKGFLGRVFNKLKGVKQSAEVHFSTTKAQIERLVNEIELSQQGLKQRVELLDRMYAGVENEYKQLGVYIAAGQLKQQELQQQLQDFSQQAQTPTLTQQIYDLNHVANNLEKRISDLQVLQQSAMQTLPMIRMIQSNNLMLVDKFYAIKNITLPAWKNQISLAISLKEQQQSVALANTIDDATNDLLKRNAELLHQNSVATAKANQRAVIDIETLEQVQNSLISTVRDVMDIQKEGMQQRQDASQRLKALQQNLQQLVLEQGTVPKQ